MTQQECSSSGTPSGNCAAGYQIQYNIKSNINYLYFRFGVCCLFAIAATSGTVSQKCSYIRNPDFPGTTTADDDVTIMVTRASDEICQLRFTKNEFI